MARKRAGPLELSDVMGAKFGMLTVVGAVQSDRLVTWKSHLVCKCECGGHSKPLFGNLRKGISTSCGCQKNKPKHGKATTRIYRVWSDMHQRCGNQNNANYRKYGARGITVCERWLKFENFYDDMGDQPPRMSLDRRDNNGPYSPDNCRWATRIEQMSNTRNNRYIAVDGERLTVAEAARIAGITHTGIRHRLRNGQSGKQLLRPKGGNK